MAALLPGYEYDVFISYRQKDNKYDGWVTEFVSNLKKEIEATFKDDVSIYFDENPHDGLLETHSVDRSLELKLKSLIIIPIVSQTYCDPKSFAWQHEFVAFHRAISTDSFGANIRLANGNIASRILPVRINDLDPEDIALFEKETGGVMRSIDFIYRLPGVNRQLRAKDDEQIKSPNQILYRDQINKVSHAIKDILNGMKHFQGPTATLAPEKPKPLVVPQPVPVPSAPSAPTGKYKKWLAVAALALLIAVAFYKVPRWLDERRAYNELLPAIQKLVDDNFTPPPQSYRLAMEAAKYIPGDTALQRLLKQVARTVSLRTQPAGVQVSWRDYNNPGDPWAILGTTPLENVRIPYFGIFKFEKAGFPPVLVTSGRVPVKMNLALDSAGTIPENMVRIPTRVTPMLIVGLEQAGGKRVGEFLMDRFEVTNRDFKRFVDAGGYKEKSYWPSPIYNDGKIISWESAMATFVDKTGKQGPANWEVGTYPNGKEDYPVDGISWYEASAFAKFTGKRLPTIYHWSVVAETNRTMAIVPLSNFSGTGTTKVGSQFGLSSFGIADVAGNVREWCSNETDKRGAHYILGGGWNDATYAFNDSYSAEGMNRTATNGFRCMKEVLPDSLMPVLDASVGFRFRDYRVEKPVDDKTFAIYKGLYAYDKAPLNEKVTTLADTGMWKVEKVTLDAAYGREQLVIYLFLPSKGTLPFQPILYFPGSNAIQMDAVDATLVNRIDFFVKSGRPLILPVFKGTFERRDDLNSDLTDESVFYRDHVIMWRKDIGRTIDYLETRKDMSVDKLGYFGSSWGGYMGGLLPAVETRIRACVLHVGGMEMNNSLPEADQLNFLPRVYQPTLMLNGQHDMFFPVETSQKPMFELLGTPAKDKRIIIYEAGHLVPRPDLIRESLAWFDKYLGPVK